MSETRRLEPLDGWGRISRGRFETEHAGQTWTVDVDFFDWDQTVGLYRDSVLLDRRRSPASFRIDSRSTIEVKAGVVGMERAELIADGTSRPLTPSGGTPEAWRLRLTREHPRLTGALVAATPPVLGLAALVGLIQLAVLAGLVDQLVPPPVTAAIGIAALAAFIDRSLRPGPA